MWTKQIKKYYHNRYMVINNVGFIFIDCLLTVINIFCRKQSNFTMTKIKKTEYLRNKATKYKPYPTDSISKLSYFLTKIQLKIWIISIKHRLYPTVMRKTLKISKLGSVHMCTSLHTISIPILRICVLIATLPVDCWKQWKMTPRADKEFAHLSFDTCWVNIPLLILHIIFLWRPILNTFSTMVFRFSISFS